MIEHVLRLFMLFDTFWLQNVICTNFQKIGQLENYVHVKTKKSKHSLNLKTPWIWHILDFSIVRQMNSF